MYGYRNTNRGYHARYHSTKRHVTSLTNTVMRFNPFKSKRHYANGKPDQTTSLAVLVTLATISVILFWVFVRALFGSSSNTNKYTSTVVTSDINPDLQRVMQLDVEKRYTAFDQLVEKQCLSTLPFRLDESAADSVLMQFQTWFWHQLWQTKVYAPRGVEDYVITQHGTILAANDPELQGMQHGQCELINDMLTLLKSNNLLEYVDDESTSHSDDSFTSFHNYNNDDLWSQNYKQLFKMDNENYDAWKLIEQSLAMEDKDPAKRRGIEIMSYNLLHSYCYNIFDHLNMNAETNDYTSHETFLHEMTRHLFSLKFADYGFSQSEIPIVAPDGTLNIGHRGVELEGDYETCPFMQKIIFYHHSDDTNNMAPQIDDALNAIRQEEYHRQHLQTYDAKMDVLFEEHCGNMVSQMQNHHVYHTNFRDNFYELSRDLVHNQVPHSRKFFIDVTNGDIVASAGRRTMQCKLIDAMIKNHGVKSGSSPSNYEMSKFNAEKLSNVRTEREFAEFIATLVSDGDLASLRHVVAEALTKFYSGEIKKKMSKHYKSTSAEYDTMLQTLASSMEQFILDVMDNTRKITHVEDNVVMDVKSGIVVAVSDSRLKSLGSSWIKVDLVNKIRQSQSKAKTTKKSTSKKQSTKSSSSSSTSGSGSGSDSASTNSELSQTVATLLHDVSKTKKDNIMAEFDEDIEHGLNTYCQSTMKTLSSFGKRQLRKNVGNLLAKRTKMTSPVVVDKGAIVEFDDVHSNQQVSKCPFVAAIAAQL